MGEGVEPPAATVIPQERRRANPARHLAKRGQKVICPRSVLHNESQPMLLQQSLIDRLRDALPQLNKAERRVTEVVLSDIDAATRMSIKELAAGARVSEPTVVRLARRMGCEGFTDFKLRLSQDNAVARMFVLNENEVLSQDADVVASHVYDAAVQSLAHSLAQRDPKALSAAAAAIVHARRLFCFGVGGSSATIAMEAENRFFRYDIPAIATSDPYRQRMAASIAGEGDVLLIFSVTGKPRSLVESANAARALGAAVVSVTRPGSPLAGESSILLPLQIVDHEKHLQIPSRTRYGQLFILDCLATLVGSALLDRSAAKLRLARSAFLTLHGPTDQQPLGD
jgi:RpiR family carbohydrate utilization transcriptional regulator